MPPEANFKSDRLDLARNAVWTAVHDALLANPDDKPADYIDVVTACVLLDIRAAFDEEEAR